MSTRPKLQIDTSADVRKRAKAVAYERDMSLNEFVLQALAKEDKQLKKLVEKDLDAKASPGRPTNK